ncbi:MAG: hypothetical protein N3A54_02305 [Patescibacteria group bacterium]|nr:hypothetical protein [Patescibacteria group bacterium]
MKKNVILAIFFLSFLIIVPIFSLLITNRSYDVSSRASESKVLPVLPPESPFIRLGLTKNKVSKGELFPVYITAKSDEQSVIEAQIVLLYDSSRFVLEEKNIRNDNIFPTLNVIDIQPGKAVFSLFGNPQAGFEPVSLFSETRIATIFLSVVGESGQTAFQLVREGDEKTSLFAPRDEQTGISTDILSSVQNAVIEVQ